MSDELPPGLRGFSRARRDVDGHTLTVFEAGEGPPVLVIHEIPAITDAVGEFCAHLVDEGFFVCAPQLFGSPGGGYGPLRLAGAMARACISREFAVFAARSHSPIVDTLRALCRQLSAERGDCKVGAIGMCLTGNFALTLAVDPIVAAPVLSQPSLPFGITPRLRRSLHATPETMSTLRRRHDEDGLTVLGLRFSRDFLCPAARFDALSEALGDGFEPLVVPAGPDSDIGVSRFAHSVVTRDLVDTAGHPTLAARARVVEFLRERLSIE